MEAWFLYGWTAGKDKQTKNKRNAGIIPGGYYTVDGW